MKSRRFMRALALLGILALSLQGGMVMPASAEELGELDLFDPSLYADGDAPTADAAEEPTTEGEPVFDEAPEAEPTPATEDTADPEAGEATPEPSEEPTEDPSVEPTVEPTAEPTTDPSEMLALDTDLGPSLEPTVEPTPEPPLIDGEAAIDAPVADLCLGLGETYALDGAKLLGGKTPSQYVSDHPEIVSVDAAGNINGAALGTATLTVTGGGATATITVAVLDGPKELQFPSSALDLGKGESRPFAATVPSGFAAAKLSYASSKPKIVQVDEAGNLSAKKTGTAVVTATAYNGAKVSCTVRVLKAPSKLKLPYKTGVMSVGETRVLAVTLPKKSASAILWSSDNPAVLTVDASGKLTGVSAGTATVTAKSFNNKKVACKVTVLDGKAPTTLNLNATTLSLGVKETFLLTPTVGEGEAAVYAFSTSKKKIATVTDKGLITAKKAGTAVITVKTQNGLTATVTVTVAKAPKKIALSRSTLNLTAGQTGQLKVQLPAGTASTILWESSDASVATVDGAGTVTAVKAGTATVRATTFNGKSAQCKIVVSAVAGDDVTLPDSDASAEIDPSGAQMIKNLKKSSVLGSKRDAIVNVVQLLIANGFEPAFAAGVAANIYSEGTYGLFESSRYVTNYQKRPKYFCYLDGGNYYTQKNGEYVVSAVYLSPEDYETYDGTADKYLRFGEENFYLKNYSGKYAQNVDLDQLEALMVTLADGKWQGKFGLGIVQWTGARTKTLVGFYRKYAGSGNRITPAQVVAAENEMILSDFKGSYAAVYTAWKKANPSGLTTAEAARSAGSIVCLRYEIPVNKESKAVTRGNKAAEIYNVMIGK